MSLFNTTSEYTKEQKEFQEWGCRAKGYPKPDWDNLITLNQIEKIKSMVEQGDNDWREFEKWMENRYKLVQIKYMSFIDADKLIIAIEKKQHE